MDLMEWDGSGAEGKAQGEELLCRRMSQDESEDRDRNQYEKLGRHGFLVRVASLKKQTDARCHADANQSFDCRAYQRRQKRLGLCNAVPEKL